MGGRATAHCFDSDATSKVLTCNHKELVWPPCLSCAAVGARIRMCNTGATTPENKEHFAALEAGEPLVGVLRASSTMCCHVAKAACTPQFVLQGLGEDTVVNAIRMRKAKDHAELANRRQMQGCDATNRGKGVCKERRLQGLHWLAVMWDSRC